MIPYKEMTVFVVSHDMSLFCHRLVLKVTAICSMILRPEQSQQVHESASA